MRARGEQVSAGRVSIVVQLSHHGAGNTRATESSAAERVRRDGVERAELDRGSVATGKKKDNLRKTPRSLLNNLQLGPEALFRDLNWAFKHGQKFYKNSHRFLIP